MNMSLDVKNSSFRKDQLKTNSGTMRGLGYTHAEQLMQYKSVTNFQGIKM